MEPLRIPEDEHRERTQRVLMKAQDDGYDGVVMFDALNIQYLTGMYHLPTERPCAVGLTDDRTEIVVPRLETEHTERDDFLIDDVHVYFDYPQGQPMERVAEMCSALGIASGSIAADSDGSPSRNGYTGPSLSAVISGSVGVEEYVTTMREQKSEAEIDLIREASTWAHYGHRLLQERIEPGRRPVTVSNDVEAAGTEVMLDTLGER